MRRWIGKVGEIIVDVVIVIYVMMEGIVVEIWGLMKGLFSKKKQEEEVEEKSSGYQCRCHQCSEEFRAAGIMMEGIPSRAFLLINPKECPKCGSFKIMPVMFEWDYFHVKGYERMWKEKEARVKEQEERSH